VVSVQISNDLKASVQRNNLALDLLLQNSDFHKETVNLESKVELLAPYPISLTPTSPSNTSSTSRLTFP
jgi:hypothetical protein